MPQIKKKITERATHSPSPLLVAIRAQFSKFHEDSYDYISENAQDIFHSHYKVRDTLHSLFLVEIEVIRTTAIRKRRVMKSSRIFI